MLANYLADVELERIAVIEWNPRNDLEKLVNIYTRGKNKNCPVSLLDIDYFFHGGPEEFHICMQQGYQTVLLDLGRAGEGRETEFLQCHKQCFFFALNEWKLQDVTAQKNLWRKGTMGFLYGFWEQGSQTGNLPAVWIKGCTDSFCSGCLCYQAGNRGIFRPFLESERNLKTAGEWVTVNANQR